MIFLIHYDRASGKLVSIDRFDDRERDVASKAKMELEVSMLGSSGSVEIVLLEAAAEEDLRLSHSRYFKTLSELRQRDSS